MRFQQVRGAHELGQVAMVCDDRDGVAGGSKEMPVMVERVDDRPEFLVVNIPIVFMGLGLVMKHHERTQFDIGAGLRDDTTVGGVGRVSFQRRGEQGIKASQEHLHRTVASNFSQAC